MRKVLMAVAAFSCVGMAFVAWMSFLTFLYGVSPSLAWAFVSMSVSVFFFTAAKTLAGEEE